MTEQSEYQTLDPLDIKLLQLLKANAREPNASLARKLGVSRATIQNHIENLKRRQIITGFTLKLDHNFQASKIQAHVMIAITTNDVRQMTLALENIPAVRSLYSISGKYDFIAILEERRMDLMDKALDNILIMPGVSQTNSSIILSTKFDR